LFSIKTVHLMWCWQTCYNISNSSSSLQLGGSSVSRDLAVAAVVNFINVFHARFSYKIFGAKISNQKVNFVVFVAKNSYERLAQKTLTKLTPGGWQKSSCMCAGKLWRISNIGVECPRIKRAERVKHNASKLSSVGQKKHWKN